MRVSHRLRSAFGLLGARRGPAGERAGGESASDAPLPGGAPEESHISEDAARRLLHVALCLGGMVALTYAIPPLHAFQPWKRSEAYVPYWNVVGREIRGEGRALALEQERFERLRRENLPARTGAAAARPPRPAPPPPDPRETATFPAFEPDPGFAEPPEVPIENAAALDPYFRRLSLVDLAAPGTVARASHWGDSLLGDDGMTFAIRQKLQARFGDAGHGFHALAPFNTFYFHRGVRFRVKRPWTGRCEVLFRKCEPDGHFGLGGVSSRSSGGAHSFFATAKEGPGDRVSRFELWFERAPEGGAFEVSIDGAAPREVPTDAPERRDDAAVFELEDGPHEIDVRAPPGRGSVRGYGVVLEREGPGVVWENLAVIGSYTMSLDHQDASHIAGQIRRRDPDLLVFSLGGNDAQRAVVDLRQNYEAEYKRVLRKFRAGKPAASCLILGVTDHGERTEQGDVRSRRSMPILVEIQRKVATDEGCAYLDLFQAMGGTNSVARWLHGSPRLMDADLGHPTGAGHEVLASLFYRALMHRYAEFRKRVTGEPLPELEAARGAAGRPLAAPAAPDAASAAASPTGSAAGADAGAPVSPAAHAPP